MIRFNRTASSQCVFPDDNVNARTTTGENTIPRTVMIATTRARVQKSRFANSHTSFSGFSFMYLVNTGMKDAVIEPSPTRRRKRLGIRYARMKESAARDVPSKSAYRWSLI